MLAGSALLLALAAPVLAQAAVESTEEAVLTFPTVRQAYGGALRGPSASATSGLA